MKNRKFALFIVLSLLLMFLLPATALAHSGRTDGNGGHYDHSTGEYHYHHGYSAHDHYDMDGDGDIDCPYTYKASDNDNKPEPTSTPSKLIKPRRTYEQYLYDTDRSAYYAYKESQKEQHEKAQAMIKASNERRAKGITGGGHSSVLDELAEKNAAQKAETETKTQSSEEYNSGYEEGYDDGYDDAEKEFRNEYERGYNNGNRFTPYLCAASVILLIVVIVLACRLSEKRKEK